MFRLATAHNRIRDAREAWYHNVRPFTSLHLFENREGIGFFGDTFKDSVIYDLETGFSAAFSNTFLYTLPLTQFLDKTNSKQVDLPFYHLNKYTNSCFTKIDSRSPNSLIYSGDLLNYLRNYSLADYSVDNIFRGHAVSFLDNLAFHFLKNRPDSGTNSYYWLLFDYVNGTKKQADKANRDVRLVEAFKQRYISYQNICFVNLVY